MLSHSFACPFSSLHSPPCFLLQQTQWAVSLLTLKLFNRSAILVPQGHRWQSAITGLLQNHICSSHASSSSRRPPADNWAELGRDLPEQYVQKIGIWVRWARQDCQGGLGPPWWGTGRKQVWQRVFKGRQQWVKKWRTEGTFQMEKVCSWGTVSLKQTSPSLAVSIPHIGTLVNTAI